jgi:hypothetical protein
MTCIIEDKPAQALKADKGPYKKRPKPCIICKKPSVGVSSYLYLADGTNKIGVPFCQQHLDEIGIKYATPVFENRSAFDRFREAHPILYNRYAAGKKPLILNELHTSGANTE